MSGSNSNGFIPADSPCLIFITLPPSILVSLVYSPSTSMKNAPQPVVAIFLAVKVFNATLLPPTACADR